MSIFYERLSELLAERGLSQKQVLSDCHLGKNSFANWKGDTAPQPSTIKVLADYFGVLPEYLEGTVTHRTREEAADAFQITADRAMENMIEWLEDNGFEVGSDYSDNGSGTTWYISKDGNIVHYEENDFRLQAVNLAEIIKHSDNFVYLTWANGLFDEPPIELSEDEEELIDIFRELNRPAIHELMAKAYELRERVTKEKRSSQTKATG